MPAPTLTTTPSSTSVTLGTSSVTLKDTAVLSGGYSPTGTITFTLYYNGATTPVDTEEATVTGNGSYSTPTGYTLPTTGTVAGTYQWDASYSGDTDNASVSDNGAASEQVTVTAEWQTGDLTTYLQPEWSGGSSSGPLSNDFDSVYGSNYGELTVGGGFTMSFDSPTAVTSYLPATGPVGPLDADLFDPTSSASGSFGGDVVALALDVDYSASGDLPANSGLQFGDLTVCGLTTDTDLNGITVSQVLAILNTALGGGATTDGIANLDPVAIDLENSFTDGTPSTFALADLAKSSACAPVSWQNGDLTTYTQAGWVLALAPAVTILNDNWDSVYGSNYDELTVGTGFTMSFDSAQAVEDYLPANGLIGPLDADLFDPTSSASGQFGGDVVALALDADFSAAGLLPGTSGLQFGDLTVCGLTTDTDLNEMTVSQVLAILNTALGGGATTDGIANLDPVAVDLENSFTDGTPSTFAQDNLVNGACP